MKHLRAIPGVRVLMQYPDFRLLWTGAFLSFLGTWIQSVAQGWLVYDITNDEAKLAMVSFCGMIPMAFLGPISGALIDTLNRRKILVVAQAIYGCNALFLAAAVHFGFVSYAQIIAISLINGVVNSFETPARQSLVGTMIPPEDLSAAVPVNAMTFNLSRVLGPAIGGQLLALLGAQLCYLINGLSYLALIFAVLAIRANIGRRAAPREPIIDLMMEGWRYTFRDLRLRTLFFMEGTTSMFGLAYIALMPAIAKDMLGLDKRGLGYAMTAIGVGTMTGLILLMMLRAQDQGRPRSDRDDHLLFGFDRAESREITRRRLSLAQRRWGKRDHAVQHHEHDVPAPITRKPARARHGPSYLGAFGSGTASAPRFRSLGGFGGFAPHGPADGVCGSRRGRPGLASPPPTLRRRMRVRKEGRRYSGPRATGPAHRRWRTQVLPSSLRTPGDGGNGVPFSACPKETESCPPEFRK